MKMYAIIVAGGSGTRMGTEKPKQFLPLRGVPVLMHAIRPFHVFDPGLEIVVVLPGSEFDHWKELCRIHGFQVEHSMVSGGRTRFHSVQNALRVLPAQGLVAIHDGVRPLVDTEIIRRCFDLASEKGNAVPVTELVESIRKKTRKGSVPVPRDDYFLVQTPQVFRLEEIQAAYNREYEPGFTDDAAVAEKAGCNIWTTEGHIDNIKITSLRDLKMAGCILEERVNHKTGRE